MISIKNISKIFKLYQSPADRLKEIVFRRCYHRVHQALIDVSLDVSDGETVGIIGENGAGKSTLLKVLTGVYLQDSGTIHLEGSIAGLLELGTGFNPEFTGIENIYLNGTFLGMDRPELDKKLSDIVNFTELNKFIHEPIKTYSSGMVMRLAFSIAIHADPTVFVVDEALGVGDAYFQQKCFSRLKQFKESGGSIIFVSHDMNAVKVLCDRAVLLRSGILLDCGDPDSIINAYNMLLARKSQGENIRVDKENAAYGTGEIFIEQVEIRSADNYQSDLLISGKPAQFHISLKANKAVDELTVGLMIRDRFGQDIFGTNSYHLKIPISMDQGDRNTLIFEFNELNIGPGKYSLTVAAHTGETHIDSCFHWIDCAAVFEVVSDSGFFYSGILRLYPNLLVTTNSE